MNKHVSQADAETLVKASKIQYLPTNPVAEFVDDYGDMQIVHRPRGRSLRQFRGMNTPALRLNRAVASLLGQRIKARRLELGLTLAQVAIRAGMHNVSPKQYIHAIETAGQPGRRTEGLRLGTLYAIAHALEVEISALLPPPSDVMELAGVGPEEFRALSA